MWRGAFTSTRRRLLSGFHVYMFPVKLEKLEIIWWFKTGARTALNMAQGDLRGPGSFIRYN